MKKVLILIAVAVGGALVISLAASRVISLLWADEEVKTSTGASWPGGLGSVDAVGAGITPQRANDAALKFTSLAKALRKNEAVDEFVGREMMRGEVAIGEPPALPDVAALRGLLLQSAPAWPRRGGVGEVGSTETSERRVAQMTGARLLVASALVRARARDAAAWEDLQAVWNLARSLDRQPEMMEQTAALSMRRMINAVAWKMPLPAPAWLEELQREDLLHRMIEAFQYQVASYADGGAPMVPTKWHASAVEHDRRIAERLWRETRCDIGKVEANDMGVDLNTVWRRVFRFRAEREATANALRVRQGTPIDGRSACSDGGWMFDGATLRFSRPIEPPPRDRAMPLVLKVSRDPDS